MRRWTVSFWVCLSVAVASCGGSSSDAPEPAPTVFTVSTGPQTSVLTSSQRSALNFQYGPPDGTIGVLLDGGTSTFFVPAGSSSSCPGTPSTEGTYRLGGSLGAFTAPYGCSAALARVGSEPNGYTFDRDYAGGGPVLAVTGAAGKSGVLHVYHGEWQGGTCRLGKCFYGSLGMAFSQDGGATFSKLGEILQPYVTRLSVIGANADLDVGGGTLLVADGSGHHIANVAAADPADTYLYVFYSDRDPSAGTSAPCSVNACLAVARAPLSSVVANAFAGNSAAFPTLFKKFFNGAFTEPGTSGDPEAATNSSHYTPVIAAAGSFPSVLYDESTAQYLIAYTTGNSAIAMRHGSTLLSWSEPIASGALSDGTNTILYPTLVGEGADPGTGQGHPWLFYVDATNWPDWSSATAVDRRLQLSYQ